MKRKLNKIAVLIAGMLIATLSVPAQDLTGIWRGYFVTESFEQYKFELQVKQNGDNLTGVTYSYLSTIFYGKATITGSFNKVGQNALVREIRTVELKMDKLSSACIMKLMFQYEKSGKEEFLEGTYTSKFEKDGVGARKGEDCGSGKVYLRKVVSSDFYVEPFLRKVNPRGPVYDNVAPVKKDSLTGRSNTVKLTTDKPKVNKPPVVNKPVVKTQTQVSKPKPVVKTPVISQPVNKPVVDSIKKISTPEVSKPMPKATVSSPAVLTTRENLLMKSLVVNNPEVTVKLFDNGEVDGDTISVYFDNKLVLSRKGLSEKPLVINLKMDGSDTDHELVMVAENLGRIPPNTSLMIVESGEQRFDVRITSTEQKNAVVRFRYQKN